VKVLVTGGAGNIGSVVVNRLLTENYDVISLDALWFDKKIPLINTSNPHFQFIKGDIRDSKLMDKVLNGVDLILHAAAVVGDPASKKYPTLTREINETSTIELVRKAKEKGVRGFFFFSTCSNYGIADGLAKEETTLNPLSLYAETKVNVERYLLNEENNIDWIIGRFSTVYGTSPRMRFDLTVNDFTMTAFNKGELDIYFPESFRPYIHTYDVSTVVASIIRNFGKMKNNVFNIGFSGENYQKIQIAEIVKKHLPDTRIRIVKEGGDRRDYKVDFQKLKNYLKIKNVYNVEKAVKELVDILNQGIITDFDNPLYYNTLPEIEEEIFVK